MAKQSKTQPQEEMSLQVQATYTGVLTGEAKVKMADRALEVIKLPNAPGVILDSGERFKAEELISQNLEMGEKFVRYTIKPRVSAFKSIAFKEIQRLGGLLAYFKVERKWSAALMVKLILWLSKDKEKVLSELTHSAVDQFAHRLAGEHFHHVANFFHQNYRGVTEEELLQVLSASSSVKVIDPKKMVPMIPKL